jgi:hypothetical protein
MPESAADLSIFVKRTLRESRPGRLECQRLRPPVEEAAKRGLKCSIYLADGDFDASNGSAQLGLSKIATGPIQRNLPALSFSRSYQPNTNPSEVKATSTQVIGCASAMSLPGALSSDKRSSR